jgi:putative DNA primase/helicase
MHDYISEFENFLAENGYIIKGSLIANNEWQDCYSPHDKVGSKHSTGRYSLKIEADTAIGCFFCWQDESNKISWSPKEKSKVSSKERRDMKKKYDAEKKKQEKKEKNRQEKLSGWLNTAYKNLPKAKMHPYLEKKDIQTHGVKIRAKGKRLIIPIYKTDGSVWNLQSITQAGNKYFFKGACINGGYFPFVHKKDDLSTILICEGFATGASIREATMMPVAAAFNAGNLSHVLHDLKKKFPKSSFVICADNDAFTFNPNKKPEGINRHDVQGDDPRWEEWSQKGMLYNVGIEKAKEAAVSNGGAAVIWPDFEFYDRKTKPTDYNDLAALGSSKEVADQIFSKLEKIPEAAPDEAVSEGETAYPVADQYLTDGDHNPQYENLKPIKLKKKGDLGLAFKCLGYNENINYYFSFKQRRIVELKVTEHSMQNLLQLDTYNNWKNCDMFAECKNDKTIAMLALDRLISICTERGVFKRDDQVRGAGAWIDNGRYVMHCGNRIYMDGHHVEFDEIESQYTYVAAPQYINPEVKPLTNIEANKLREICESVTWSDNLSGTLLAGWIVVAPLCGALPYRPHIWITGEHSSGKSTVMNDIIRRAVGKIAINSEQGTTEASIRQEMAYDARPIAYDEAEKDDRVMAEVVKLARKATTGGVVMKFGQGRMKVNFAACFSSVNVPVSNAADESRMTFLRITKNRRSTAIQDFERLMDLIEATLTKDFPDRLLARTIRNMDALFHNIKMFKKGARRVFGDARMAEQIGTMMAGLYLLHSTKKITDEMAESIVRKYNWSDHIGDKNDNDPVRLIQHIATSIISYTSASGLRRDCTIGELIVEAGDQPDKDSVLRRHGIRRIGNDIFIASNHKNIHSLLRGTDWSDRWHEQLRNISGAEHIKSQYFCSGFRNSAVKLPLSLFLEKEDQTELAL